MVDLQLIFTFFDLWQAPVIMTMTDEDNPGGLSSHDKRLKLLEAKFSELLLTAGSPPETPTTSTADSSGFIPSIIAQKQKNDEAAQKEILTSLKNDFEVRVLKRCGTDLLASWIPQIITIAVQTVEEWAPRLIKALGLIGSFISGFKKGTALTLVGVAMPNLSTIFGGLEFLGNMIDEVVNLHNVQWKSPAPQLKKQVVKKGFLSFSRK